MLQFLAPALFQTDNYLDLLGEPRLPGLDMLFARGRKEMTSSTSLEEQLSNELGIARQQDWPIAPITLAATGGMPGKDYWLRADPVHVRIDRDQLILIEIDAPTQDETALLCEALAAHFGEEFSPQPLHPGAWVVRSKINPSLVTTPLSQAAGHHIDRLLPTGSDAMHWRKLLNEAQMLLFQHPVNQAREQRGEPAINSVWIWGGGRMPDIAAKSDRTVYCNHPDWQALAKYAGSDVRVVPEEWVPDISDNALIVMDQPHRLLRGNDLNAWLQGIRDFEHKWLQPLIASGRPFRIDDPLQGNSLYWRNIYRWKFWKRAQKPVKQSIKLQSPPSDPGVDAFGNRY